VLGRSSATEKLYDMAESSMDEIGEGTFQPTDTSGFIEVQSIRLRKWGESMNKAGIRQ
jgi:argininosuccinate synthase